MKLLVVGLGSMGKRRARLAQSLGHTLFGVDTADSRRAEAENLGITAYASIHEALAAQPIEAAFVCTAPLSHAGVIRTLLQAGVPVFTELNLVADGYEELQQLAAQKGVPLFLSSTMLYRAEIAYIRQKVAEHGKPVNYIYHIGQYLPDWHPWENYKDFFVGEVRTSGVREIFGIEMPWLVSTFGPAKVRCAEHARLSTLELPYDDSVYVSLRHESGACGFVAADVVSPKAVRKLEVVGEGLHLLWEGSPTTLQEWDATTKTLKNVQTYKSFEHDDRYSDNIVENAYLDEILNFIGVLQGTAQPRWSFEKDAKVLRLMDEMGV